MKYYFYKSKLLTMIFTFIVFLFSVVGSAYFNQKDKALERNSSSDQSILYLIIFLTILLIFLSSATVTYNWIHSRRREIAVRKLIGAGKRDIYGYIWKNYLILMLFSYVVGIILSVGLFHLFQSNNELLFLVDLLGDSIHIKGLLCSFLFSGIIGVFVVELTLIQYDKMETVENIRG